MNKKITTLSLAGVMLLSSASPVFAATEAKTEVKEPTKAEQMVKDAKEAGKEIAKDAKEAMTDAKEKVEEKGKEAVKETKEVAKEVKEVKEEVKEKVEIEINEKIIMNSYFTLALISSTQSSI